MSRPPGDRPLFFESRPTLFVPSGVPRCRMESVALEKNEVDALRLIDLEEMGRERAAELLGVSEQKLEIILGKARSKAAEALALGKSIQILDDGQISRLEPSRISAGCAGAAHGSDCARDSGQGCRDSSGGCQHGSSGVCGQDQEESCSNSRRDSCPGAGCGHRETVAFQEMKSRSR